MARAKQGGDRAELLDVARTARQQILDSGLPFPDSEPEPTGKGGETKVRILDTAITIFGERGLEACTMRDLGSEVGIKAPAIYNHYRSKEDVLAAAMEYILGRFFWTVIEPLGDAPIEDWLEQLVLGHIRFQLEHRRLSQANDALLNGPGKKEGLPADVYKRIVATQRSYADLFCALIRSSRPEIDQKEGMIAGFAIAAICDRAAGWFVAEGDLSIDQVAELNWRLARQMIGA
jgi:TetR/AcrR family transcriptional regulator, cholesterol catabolism regulator